VRDLERFLMMPAALFKLLHRRSKPRDVINQDWRRPLDMVGQE